MPQNTSVGHRSEHSSNCNTQGQEARFLLSIASCLISYSASLFIGEPRGCLANYKMPLLQQLYSPNIQRYKWYLPLQQGYSKEFCLRRDELLTPPAWPCFDHLCVSSLASRALGAASPAFYWERPTLQILPNCLLLPTQILFQILGFITKKLRKK